MTTDRITALEEALEKMLHAVCGETGFASCVRGVSGYAYPWPALDEAEEAASAALAASRAAPDCRQPDLVTAALHRSFPEAGDGRPMPPMGDDLMTAGLSADDARFVAVQLAQNGLTLVPVAALDLTPAPAVEPVALTYTNWRGQTAVRRIVPLRVWFGSTAWHPEPQWLLTAIDMDKGFERDFALAGFGQPVTAQDAARVLLADDTLISRMAEAIHDGPLGADDQWFSAATPQGAWCVDVVRAALRAIGGDA